MGKIRIETRFSKRFGVYLAVAPDFYYCTGLGKTPEEARQRVEQAVSLWFGKKGGRLSGLGGDESEPGH